MGITGLLGALKSIQKPVQLKQFKGQTLGIDGYGWLHRGAVACALALALGTPTTKYVSFFISQIRMLEHFGVVPYVVFDGANLPSKAGTDSSRHSTRAASRLEGMELLRLGKKQLADKALQKALDVTPEMAGHVIRELRQMNVKYVVAPYEADAQLIYLEQQGLIDGILSDDSDLLVFGAKVLLTKLGKHGDCIMIRRQDFTACREMSLVGWSDQDFRRMAILSGCDYLNNIDSIGLVTAYRLMRKHKTVDRIIQALKLEGKKKIPQDYLINFYQAERTFLYQWVFCPLSNTLVNLTLPDPTIIVSDMPYIGSFVEAAIATGIAKGELHPSTKRPLEWLRDPKSTLKPNSKNQESLKPSKDKLIPGFFKRVPLAEMDPNSFIMTPKQQELARGGSSRLQSSPVVPQSPTFEPRAISRPGGSWQGKSISGVDKTSPKSPKVTSTSKFFASSAKKRKRPEPEFTIHLDDSIVAIFDELENESPSKKISTNIEKASDNESDEATLVDTSQTDSERDGETTFVEELESITVKVKFEQFLHSDAKKSSKINKDFDVPDSLWAKAEGKAAFAISASSSFAEKSSLVAHGSEDFLVSDSEAELEPDPTDKVVASLKLRRFACKSL